MALQPVPLNNCSCRVSSSTLSRSPALHFLAFQPHLQGHVSLKFRVCCSNQTAQVDTQPVKVPLEASKIQTKKKSNQRPSFFDQIRDKWSLKLGSQRDKFPWQEQPQRYQQPQDEEEKEGQSEEEEEEEDDDEDDEYEEERNQKNSASYSMDFKFPKRFSPWPQAAKPTNPQFDSYAAAEKNVKPLHRKIGGSLAERERVLADVGEVLSSGVEESTSSREEEKRGLFNDYVAGSVGEGERKRRSNADFAERLIPEHELRRLRNVALRMVERFDVGVSGITQEIVDSIHDKWRYNEVVKLKFGSPLSANMRRTHQILERKTGGLVVWRSGSSIVLYRGMTYKLPCVELYTKMNHAKENALHVGSVNDDQVSKKEPVNAPESLTRDTAKYLKDLTKEELMELSDLNHLLDELGPRFKDWTGREPLPVDADLLPALVPGYKTPFRLLPYGLKHSLTNQEMTQFRRLARQTAPHFALGRSRDLQGLARAMVQLWQTSAIAKIAIKRGVPHARNEIMAEELRKLTGGTLLSRNKEYIVFYRGNDFLPPAITNTLTEREKLTLLQQDEEEKARQNASLINGSISNRKASQVPCFAGTLAETRAATTTWGHQPSREVIENMRRDSAINRFAALIRTHEKKLAQAKLRFRKAEKALAKLQADLEPADLPTDLETLTDEERFLFRKIGLSMKPYLVLGRRDVYSGTIENMHLHWKYRELVKIIVKGRNAAQVKHIAISLEAESGGVLVSVDKDTKGYIIIIYRGKNYFRPLALRPKNLLSRRQALARSIELQRREALKHHVLDLEERIELMKSELDDMKNGKKIDSDQTLYSALENHVFSDDDLEGNEGTENYFEEDDSVDEDEKTSEQAI